MIMLTILLVNFPKSLYLLLLLKAESTTWMISEYQKHHKSEMVITKQEWEILGIANIPWKSL